MARPEKFGLDYFPLDVDMFEDEKVMALSGEFGIKGEITLVKLLCAIYHNGYYALWNELLKYKLCHSLPGITPELIESIVQRLVRWEFFDKDLFNSTDVLTSKGIQKRYFSAIKHRTPKGNLPYLLVENSDKKIVFSEETTVEHEFSPRKLHKVKERKENNITALQLNTRDEKSFLEELKQQDSFLESAAMRYKITTSDVIDFLDDFELENVAANKTHKDFNDYRRHALNWLRYRVSDQKTDKDGDKDTARQHREVEAARIMQRLASEER